MVVLEVNTVSLVVFEKSQFQHFGEVFCITDCINHVYPIRTFLNHSGSSDHVF